MRSLLERFRKGLAKTVSALAARTHGLFGAKAIDAASLETLEEALYSADFGVETTAEILGEIKAAYAKDKALQGRQAAEIGAEVLRRVLGRRPRGGPNRPCPPRRDHPHRGQRLGQDDHGGQAGRPPEGGRGTTLLAAGDTFRAAAIDS